MTKKELLKNIYELTTKVEYDLYLYDPSFYIKLNIDRGEYFIISMTLYDGVVVDIRSRNGNIVSKYLDELRLSDQISIYKELMKIDMYNSFRIEYPHLKHKEIEELCDGFVNNMNRRKVIHRKG